MCESCDEWKLGCVRVKDCLSYVDGQWCVGNLVCGGFSVSNYLQGVMGPRRNGYLVLAGEILKICQAQVEGDGSCQEKELRRNNSKRRREK